MTDTTTDDPKPKGPPPEDEAGDAGHHGAHPEMNQDVLVAPALEDGEERNTLRPALSTVACFRLDDARFEFDSSFVLPEARREFRRLGELRKDYKDSPMSIFGHADPVGDDDYNKKLSGRRAMAVYGLITRNYDMWEKLYGDHSWGLKSTQRILEFFTYYEGPSDGVSRKTSTDAVKAFQTDNGLAVDGDPGPNTRKKLYELYMDAICVDDAGKPFSAKPEEFLGKGADPKGKADYQGCSEFNPVLLFSKKEDDGYKKNPDKKERNANNAPNRRVTLFFFRPGLTLDVAKWPCPRASEGTSDCKKRFWSDHDKRLTLDEENRRSYEKTHDTFACRFYDRFARRSPCEAGYKEWIVQLLQSGPEAAIKDRKPLSGVKYRISGTGGADVKGTTDANGIVRARVTADVTKMKLTLLDSKLELTLLGGELKEIDPGGDKAIKDRLYNLGYGPGDRSKWSDESDKDGKVYEAALKQFQKEYGLTDSGKPDGDTKTKLREVYGS